MEVRANYLGFTMKMTKEYILDDIQSVMRTYQSFMPDDDVHERLLFNYLVNHTRLHDNANARYILPIVQEKLNDIRADLPEIYLRIREEILLLKMDRIL